MPDFRVIGQSPVPRADLGAAYDRGLGGAVPDTLTNLVEGFQKGLDFGSILDARLQRTARENDPAVIADENLERDLRRDILNQELKESQRRYDLDLEYGELERDVGLRGKEALTRKQEIDNALQEAYGPDREAAEIQDLLNRGTRSGGRRTDPNALELQRSKRITDLINAKRQLAKPLEQKEGFPGQPVEAPTYDANTQQQIDAIDAEIERLQNQAFTPEYETQMYEYDASEARKRFEQSVQQSRAKDRTARTATFNQTLNEANEAASYTDALDPESNVGLESWLDRMAEVNSLFSKFLPNDERVIASQGIAEAIKFAGPQRLESYAESLSGQPRENFEREFNRARANSADPDLLTPIQKTIQGTGLPQEYVADPKKTMQNLSVMLNFGEMEVEDPAFKDTLRDSPYVVAAQNALQQAPSFQMLPQPVQIGDPNGIDASGQPTEAVKMVFKKPDGTDFNPPLAAEMPRTPKEQAALNLVGAYARQLKGESQLRNTSERQGQQVIAQNQQLQQQLRAGPQVQPVQQQQAPFGAGPQAQPPATGPKAVDHLYSDTDPVPADGPTAYRFKDRDGSIHIVNLDAGLTYPERNTRTNIDKYKTPDGRTTFSSVRLGQAVRMDAKPLAADNLKALNQLESDKKTLDQVQRVIGRVEALGLQDYFGPGGTIPRTAAQWREIARLGNSESQEAVELAGELERLKAQILKDFVSQGQVSSVVNTPTEQETIVASVFRNGMPFEVLKSYSTLEQNRIAKESDKVEFVGRLLSDERNDPNSIIGFIADYEGSEFSKPNELNPEKFERTADGEWRVIPGREDQPDFVENDTSYTQPQEYLLFRDNAGREFAPPQGTYIPGTATQASPTPTPTPQPNLPGAQPTRRPISDRMDRAVDPNEPDLVTTPASANEADISFFGEPAAQAGTQTQQTIISNAPEERRAAQGQAELLGQPPAPTGAARQQVQPSIGPPQTKFEARGNQFQSPSEADTYNRLVEHFESQPEQLTARWVADLMAFNQGEEIETQIRKWLRDAGVPSAQATDRQIEMIAAAREQAIRDLGNDPNDPIGKTPKTLIEIGTNILQNLNVASAGRRAIVGAAGQVAKRFPGAANLAQRANQSRQGQSVFGDIARAGTKIGGYAVADATSNTLRQRQPGDTSDELLQRFVDEGIFSAGVQTALSGPARLIGLGARAIGLGSDEKSAARLLATRYGVSREQLDDFFEQTKDLPRDADGNIQESALGLLPPEMKRLAEDLAANPLTRPYITSTEKARQLAADVESARNYKQNFKFDRAKSQQLMQDDYVAGLRSGRRERMAEVRGEQAQMTAGATEVAERTARTAEEQALSQTAEELGKANEELFRTSAAMLDDVVSGSKFEADKWVNTLDEQVRAARQKGIEFEQAAVNRPGPTIISPGGRVAAEAEALQTVQNNLKAVLNGVYQPVDDITIDDDIMKGVYDVLENQINPAGRDAINKTFYAVGGPGRIEADELGEVVTKAGITPDAHSLIEMRRIILGKGIPDLGPKTKQANRLVKAIEDALDEQFARSGYNKGFREFLQNQSGARQFHDQLGERIAFMRQIEDKLARPTGNRDVHNLIFKDQQKVRDVFGETGATILSKDLQAIDKFTKAIDDYKQAVEGGNLEKLSPAGKEILESGKAQAKFTTDIAKRSGDEAVVRMKEAIKESRGGLTEAGFFVQKLIKSPTGLADKAAKVLGYKDRTQFSDATVSYLKQQFDDAQRSMAGKDFGQRRSLSQQELTGLSPAEFDNALSMITRPERELIEKAYATQQRIDRGRFLFDKPVAPVRDAQGDAATRTAQAFTSMFGRVRAAVALADSKIFNILSVREQKQLAQVMTDPDPNKLVQFLEKVAPNIRRLEEGGGVSGNLLKFDTALDVARSFANAMQPFETEMRANRRQNLNPYREPSIQFKEQPLRSLTAADLIERQRGKPAPKRRGKTAAELLQQRR